MCGECDCEGVICEGVSVILSLCRYANIFVTSPSPENLQTLFQFVLKGFDAVGYSEHEDYELVQSTNPEYGKAVIRINIFHEHRQTVQVLLLLGV